MRALRAFERRTVITICLAARILFMGPLWGGSCPDPIKILRQIKKDESASTMERAIPKKTAAGYLLPLKTESALENFSRARSSRESKHCYRMSSFISSRARLLIYSRSFFCVVVVVSSSPRGANSYFISSVYHRFLRLCRFLNLRCHIAATTVVIANKRRTFANSKQ